MITQREDGSMYVNLTATVFFNWFARENGLSYTLMVSIEGNSLGGVYMPPECFRLFILYWRI